MYNVISVQNESVKYVYAATQSTVVFSLSLHFFNFVVFNWILMCFWAKHSNTVLKEDSDVL